LLSSLGIQQAFSRLARTPATLRQSLARQQLFLQLRR
jgi:hypothetical protein